MIQADYEMAAAKPPASTYAGVAKGKAAAPNALWSQTADQQVRHLNYRILGALRLIPLC